MNVAKITISIDQQILSQVDYMVRARIYANRSQAVQSIIQEKLSKVTKTRLAQECSKLDSAEEQAMAEEGIALEAAQWPVY